MVDFLFAMGGVCFIIALIPSVLAPWHNKPALSTSLMTGLWLLIFSGCYVSLGLYLAAITTLVSGNLWLLLAYQKKFTEQNAV